MVRRIHVKHLQTGENLLDAEQAHHVFDVLRMATGNVVEIFDDAGQVADGTLLIEDRRVIVQVETVRESTGHSIQLTIAAAVPKGDRADWMIEKLSELGVHRFIPLAAERSVVVPTGKNKTERWIRLAVESAKQSRRAGIMEIAAITEPMTIIASSQSAIESQQCFYLSTRSGAPSIVKIPGRSEIHRSLILFVGPEGGWTEREMAGFEQGGVSGISLTSTVLRVETAAIAAAAIVMCTGYEKSYCHG